MSFENPFESRMIIPEEELQFSFASSGGPGGQGVNTSNSKAVLRWNVGASSCFSDEEKMRIRTFFGKRVNANDEVVMSCSTQRSQLRNRQQVTEELNVLVAKALFIEKERKATKPTRGSEQRRLNEKTAHGRKKAERGQRHED